MGHLQSQMLSRATSVRVISLGEVPRGTPPRWVGGPDTQQILTTSCGCGSSVCMHQVLREYGGVSFRGRLEASCWWGQLSQALKTKEKMSSGRPAGHSILDSSSGPGSPPSLGPCTYCSRCLEFFSLRFWQTAVGLRLGSTPPLGSPSPQPNPSPSSPLSSSVTFPEHPHKIPPRPP